MAIDKRNIINRFKNYFSSPRGGKKIPYRTGTMLIKWFCSTSYARNEYFRKKVHLINTFLKDTGLGESSPILVSQMLNAFFLKKWKIMAISNLNERKFKKYIKITNLDTFREKHAMGKGIIVLSSHFGYTEASISLFPRFGFTDFYTIVGAGGATSQKFTGINKKFSSRALAFDNFSDVELFKLMLKAKEVLENGGIIHLLGDGYHGKSSQTFRFLGKLRGFRGSYAELAISTGAEIFPVFIKPGERGKIHVDILPPLDKGSEEQSREERTKHMVQQYVNLLSEAWQEYPQFINWGHMEKFLHHIDQ